MANILLLETDKLIARSVVRAFELRGHKVDWQVDPQEAIISADIQVPDLIVMDLILAGRSGIEFLYELRSYPDWQRLPVVIFTNVPVREVGESRAGFEQLDIKAYHYKPTTRLSDLVVSAESFLRIAKI